MIQRLHQLITAVCPIIGVRIGNRADRSTWTFDATPTATQAERDAAQAVIDSFDDSPQAQAAWESQQSRQSAVAAIDARSDEVGRVVRAALRLINASLNQIRQQLNLPTITWQQVRQQLAQMIQNGQGDPEA